MQDNQHLLKLLNKAGYHSGTALGEELGISRVAVQKRITQMVGQGLPVTALHGKGYSLDDGVILLDKEQLEQSLADCSADLDQVEVLQTINSTNAHLINQPIHENKARLCLAESQLTGRGRRGNEWVAAPYRNVLMSISWGFKQWPETISGLSLAVSLVVAQRINLLYGINSKIKWPNDILVNGQKLAGILIDVTGETGGACNVVVGLGLNVWQPEEQPFEADYQWQSLHGLNVQLDRNELVAHITRDLIAMLKEFETHGFSAFANQWNDLSYFNNKRIKIISSNKDTAQGLMMGIDEHGALMLKQDEPKKNGQNKISRYVDSSVSVRLA